MHRPARSVVLGLVVLASPAAPLLPSAAAQLVFEPPAAVDSTAFAKRVLVGDLDEDGLLDLVTSRYSFFLSFGVPVLNLGLGDGEFGAPLPLNVAVVFRLADFDADGHLDLLVGGGGSSNQQAVSVRFGDGQGGFGPALGISDSSSGQDPDDAAVGDFNADGALDVVIHKGIEPFLLGRITVVFGHGDGSFDPPVIVVPFAGLDFGHTGRIEVGDTNGDGLHDIVYTTGHSSPVLLGQGDGTFSFAPCTDPGCGLTTDRDFVLVDVNGDGRDDAVTNQRVLLAQPDGTLGAGQVFPTFFVPFAVAVGDLDDDGVADVVLGRNGIPAEQDITATLGDLLALRGNGDGTFQTGSLVVSHVPQPRSLALGDLDGDGRTDVAVAAFQPSHGTRVLLNHTYESGSPFLDLGGALAGSNGYPIQLASGTLVAGQPFAFKLHAGPPGGLGFHIVGLSRIDAPFKGGVMIPMPNLINGPFPLGAAGELTLAGNWPAGGSGLTLYAQFWMPNGGGPFGFVASSGARAQIP
ncbi:MAG TPA: VCBS repeat-containing protein [Planctomycetota bacterium]|nr:VCBS repeat-containing protein [Planctomycetota bacterium]